MEAVIPSFASPLISMIGEEILLLFFLIIRNTAECPGRLDFNYIKGGVP